MKKIEIMSGNIVDIFKFKNKIYVAKGLAHLGSSSGAIYEVTKNGVEKVNTLTNLNISYNNQFLNHNIAGNSILYKTVGRIWNCPECNPGERRLRSRILDKNTGRAADFFMRRTVINGQQVLQVKIDNISPDFESANPSDFSLPTGEFTMVKQ